MTKVFIDHTYLDWSLYSYLSALQPLENFELILLVKSQKNPSTKPNNQKL